MKITSNHLAQFLRAYAVIAFCACILFLLQATDKANFISMFLGLLLMLVVIVITSYIIKLEHKIIKHTEDLRIQDKLTILYYELNAAESDLHCFESTALDSGEANWVKDQNRYIENLKKEIDALQQKL